MAHGPRAGQLGLGRTTLRPYSKFRARRRGAPRPTVVLPSRVLPAEVDYSTSYKARPVRARALRSLAGVAQARDDRRPAPAPAAPANGADGEDSGGASAGAGAAAGPGAPPLLSQLHQEVRDVRTRKRSNTSEGEPGAAVTLMEPVRLGV